MGVLWMLAQALMPATIGKAIDAGIAAHDPAALRAGGLVRCSASASSRRWPASCRHRCAVFNWLSATYRTIQLTVRHAGHLGATLPRRLATGEVVSIGTADVSHIGNAIDITARGVGSIVAIIAVTVILLTASVPLGLVVVLGVPVLLAIVGAADPAAAPPPAGLPGPGRQADRPRRRHRDRAAGAARRRRRGDVLRAATRRESQQLRAAGVRVARVESLAGGAPRYCCPACSWRW